MRGGEGVHEGEVVRVVAVQCRSAGGKDPEEIPVLHPVGIGKGVEIANCRAEAVRLAVQLEQGGRIGHQDLPVPSLPDLVRAPAPAQDGDAAEAAFRRPDGDAAVGRGPEFAGRTAEDVVHHVVREAQGVLGVEVLVILVYAIFVQAAGGGDPDVTVVVLGEGVHPLVGQPVGHHDASVGAWNGLFPFPAGGGYGDGEEEDGYQSFFHRCR